MQNLNFSYKDAYFLPVWKRIWFIRKLKHELEKSAELKNNTPTQPVNNKRMNNMFKKSF